MKLKNIILSILAGFALISCNEEFVIPTMDELTLDNSYVSFAKEGGTASINISTKASWALDIAKIPDWLTVAPTSGGVGDYTITFTAGAATKTRTVKDFPINILNDAGEILKAQYINIEQAVGYVEPVITPISEVLNGTIGVVYRIKGTVTDIASYKQYGGFAVKDATGSVVIYNSENSAKFQVEVGDIITCEGPWSKYNNLEKVTILSLEKSLISAVDKSVEVEKAGGKAIAKLVCKSTSGVNYVIPDSLSWITVQSLAPLKDTTVVTFSVAKNESVVPRSAFIEFTTTSGGKEYKAQVEVSQKGEVIPIASAISQANKDGVACVVQGTVVGTCTRGVILKDNSGLIYMYQKNIDLTKFTIGDEYIVSSKAKVYNFAPELDAISSTTKVGHKSYSQPKEPTVIDATAAAKYLTDVNGKTGNVDAVVEIKYISMTGKLVVSGSYFNVEIDGADKAKVQGSLSYPISSLGLADLNDKNVTVYGYINSISTSGSGDAMKRFLNITVTSVKENN